MPKKALQKSNFITNIIIIREGGQVRTEAVALLDSDIIFVEKNNIYIYFVILVVKTCDYNNALSLFSQNDKIFSQNYDILSLLVEKITLNNEKIPCYEIIL